MINYLFWKYNLRTFTSSAYVISKKYLYLHSIKYFKFHKEKPIKIFLYFLNNLLDFYATKIKTCNFLSKIKSLKNKEKH